MPQNFIEPLIPYSSPVKFVASVLTHALSRSLSSSNYEVLHQTYVDLNDLKSPLCDIVVYDTANNHKSIIAIQIVINNDIASVAHSMELLRSRHDIAECFIYGSEEGKWIRLTENYRELSSFSSILQTDIQQILDSAVRFYI